MHQNVSAGNPDDHAADVKRTRIGHEVYVRVFAAARVRRCRVHVYVEGVAVARYYVDLRVRAVDLEVTLEEPRAVTNWAIPQSKIYQSLQTLSNF